MRALPLSMCVWCGLVDATLEFGPGASTLAFIEAGASRIVSLEQGLRSSRKVQCPSGKPTSLSLLTTLPLRETWRLRRIVQLRSRQRWEGGACKCSVSAEAASFAEKCRCDGLSRANEEDRPKTIRAGRIETAQ